MKKKRIITGSIIFLVLIAALIVIRCINNPIRWRDVDRVELKTYSHSYRPGTTQVVLNKDEARKVICKYNNSLRGGEITAQPCCAAYWLEVYFKDGTMIRIAEGIEKRATMITKWGSNEPYYVKSGALIRYVRELMEKYEMASD